MTKVELLLAESVPILSVIAAGCILRLLVIVVLFS